MSPQQRRRRLSSTEREAQRARWRAFVLPHWPRLKADVLTVDEARVLQLRLGLINDRAMTLEQIARRLSCSDMRVANLETSAFRKVRAALNVKECLG